MAAIPTIALSGFPAQQLGVKADTGPLLASSNAREVAFQTIGQSAGQIAQIYSSIQRERQAHIDRGTLASEDSIRKNTARVVEKYMEDNQGDPDKWGKFHEQTWKAYEAERNKRVKSWSPQLIEEDNIRMKRYREDTDINFGTIQNRALIKKANSQLETNAKLRLNNGDINGAVEQINSMNLDYESKKEKLDQVINGGIYRQYDRLLTDTSKLPAARQVEELSKIENGLVNRDANGNYTSGFIKDEKGNVIGGLGEPARLDILRNVRSSIRHANVAMSQTGSTLVKNIKLGDDPNLIFKQALNNGEITPEIAAVFVPEARAALAEKEAIIEEKQGIAGEKIIADINRKMGSQVTMQEIRRREALGVIRPNAKDALSKEAANRARAELQAIQESEWVNMGEDEDSVRVKLEKMVGQGVTQKIWDKAQMTPQEQRDILGKISTERISVDTKTRLLDLFFAAQKWDLNEAEISDKDGDRDISPEEKKLRSTLIQRYRENQSVLSVQAIGQRYMSEMEQISQWYRDNSNASKEQRAEKAKEFENKLGRDLDDEAGSTILSGIPVFQ